MKQDARHLTVLLALLASFAIGCGGGQGGGAEPGGDREAPPSGNGTSGSAIPGAITWCSTALSRTGTVAGTSLDYPSTPATTWFNTSLEEIALSAIDREMMEEVGLNPDDNADVARFAYFIHGFDFRLILGDTPAPGNWFGKSDLSVYLFDVVDTATAPDASIAVFDASAVREARLSGDKTQLAGTIRTTVDAMKTDRRPKAIVAFAPDRNPESSFERAFINLFARNVYFAVTGSVALSNLRDLTGVPVAKVVYPLRNVRTLDVSAQGEIGGTSFVGNASCLDLQISG